MGVFKSHLYQLIYHAIRRAVPKIIFRKYVFLDEGFFEFKEISCLHLIWRGSHVKDMKITVDLVPAFKYEKYKPPYRYTKSDCTYYVFGKEHELNNAYYHVCQVAFSDVELKLINQFPKCAKEGFQLVKAMRVASLFPNNLIILLTEVYCLQDCLKTYILKTSLFYCWFTINALKIPADTILRREEWAYLIVSHLEQRLLTSGYFPTLFDIKRHVRGFYLFSCVHKSVPFNQETACCKHRKNLLLICTYLRSILEIILKSQNRPITSLRGIAQITSMVDPHIWYTDGIID